MESASRLRVRDANYVARSAGVYISMYPRNQDVGFCLFLTFSGRACTTLVFFFAIIERSRIIGSNETLVLYFFFLLINMVLIYHIVRTNSGILQ